MKKYELVGDTNKDKIQLCQIRALKDFSNVKKGDLGGWIMKESNLGHRGDCWVYPDAVVCENAKIRQNAKIRKGSYVGDKAIVSGDCQIKESEITGKAEVLGHAIISNSEIKDYARVWGNADVVNSIMEKYASAYDNAQIKDSYLLSSARVFGEARVENGSYIGGRAKIYDNAFINNGDVNDNAEVCENGSVEAGAYLGYSNVVCGDASLYGKICIVQGPVILTGNVHIGPNGFPIKDFYYMKDKKEKSSKINPNKSLENSAPRQLQSA